MAFIDRLFEIASQLAGDPQLWGLYVVGLWALVCLGFKLLAFGGRRNLADLLGERVFVECPVYSSRQASDNNRNHCSFGEHIESRTFFSVHSTGFENRDFCAREIA